MDSETSSPVLAAHQQIDVEPILQADTYTARELLKAEAVSALANIVEHHGLDSRQLSLRTRDLRRVLNRKMRPICEESDNNGQELHLHFKIGDAHHASKEEFDRYCVNLADRIEDLLKEDDLGEVEGNEIGQGEIILFCVGSDAKRMLERIGKLVTNFAQNEEDYLIRINGTEEKIFKIAELES
jgi:hypothetical protein